MKNLVKFTGFNGEPCYVFKKAFLQKIKKIRSLDPFIIGSRLSDGRKVTPTLVYKCLYCRVPEYDKIAQGLRKYYNYLLLEKEAREIKRQINSLQEEFKKEAQQYAESHSINNPHYELDVAQEAKLAELQNKYYKKSEEAQALLKELKKEGIINRNGLTL